MEGWRQTPGASVNESEEIEIMHIDRLLRSMSQNDGGGTTGGIDCSAINNTIFASH